MTVDEVLDHADAVVREAGSTVNLPSLPIINENAQPEGSMGIRLPGEPPSFGIESVSIPHPGPRL